MTDLDRVVTRRSKALSHRGRRIIITLYPKGLIGLKEERTQKEFFLAIDSEYAHAVRNEVAAQRAEKMKAKKERKAKQ
jgi:hypothetical protein